MTARILIFVLGFALPTAVWAQDWNQWRGPNRDGYLPASPALLNELPPEGISPVWMSENNFPTGGGGGWSSPVVAGERVYLFAHLKNRRDGVTLPDEKYPKLEDETREKLSKEELDEYEAARREEQQQRREKEFRHIESLVCFNATSGEQLWKSDFESRQTRFAQSASPAVFDGVVFVHGARGKVRAVDAETGKEIWETQLPGEFDDEPHAASVAAADSTVIVVAGRLYGIDARTGKVRWQGEDEIHSDDASPAIWKHQGEAYVLAHVGNETVCVDVKNGKQAWRVESNAGRSTPVVAEDRLITYGNSRKGGVRCFAMSTEKADLLWTNTDVADEGSSPVVVDGHAYVHGDRRLVCISLEDGKTKWRRELDIERPRYTSLIAADNKVIFAAGGLLCFAAQPDRYHLLVNGRINTTGRVASEDYFRDVLKIDELERTAEGQKEAESLWRKEIEGSGPAQCVSPAMADGKIYLRLKNNRLACYDLRLR